MAGSAGPSVRTRATFAERFMEQNLGPHIEQK